MKMQFFLECLSKYLSDCLCNAFEKNEFAQCFLTENGALETRGDQIIKMTCPFSVGRHRERLKGTGCLY